MGLVPSDKRLRNPAELALDADAGMAPLVATGPEGDAYRVRGFGKYLVLRKRAVTTEGTKQDEENGVTTVASREVWTDSMKGVRELVDPVRYPKPVCRCVKCRAKRKGTKAVTKKKSRSV